VKKKGSSTQKNLLRQDTFVSIICKKAMAMEEKTHVLNHMDQGKMGKD